MSPARRGRPAGPDLLRLLPGNCGFGAQIRVASGGTVAITEVAWDTTTCAAESDRTALGSVLQQVTAGRLESATSLRLTSPAGDLVLARQ